MQTGQPPTTHQELRGLGSITYKGAHCCALLKQGAHDPAAHTPGGADHKDDATSGSARGGLLGTLRVTDAGSEHCQHCCLLCLWWACARGV